jgi:hypothetical protein
MRVFGGMAVVAVVGLALAGSGFALASSDLSLVGLCVLLAFCIKGMDQAVDLDSMATHRRLSYPLALGVPIITIYLAISHDPVFGLVMGTAIGLLLAGKWDHPSFYVAGIGFIVFMIGFILVFRVPIAITSFFLIPMAAAGNWLDEFTHERTAGKGGLEHFFEHRPVLKIIALFAVLIGFAEWIHLAGLLAFDISYDYIAMVWKD